MWPALLSLPRTKLLPIGLHLTPSQAMLAQFRQRGGQVGVQALASASFGQEEQDESVSPDEHDRRVAAFLRRLIAEHGFRGRQVVSCLGPPHVFVQNLRLPPSPPEETARLIRREAEECLPYPLDEAEFRHYVIGDVRRGGELKQEILLAACHRPVLRRHLSILERAGLVPVAIEIAPFALLRGLVAADAPPVKRAYLHFGERDTGVVMAEGARLLFYRSVGTGSSHLDQAVARHLALSPSAASQMRSLVMSTASFDSQSDVHQAVTDAIREPMDALCAEIEMCLRYFQTTFRGRSIESMLVAGAEATGWMVEEVQRRLGLATAVADPLEGCFEIPDGTRERAARWSVACGLSRKRQEMLSQSSAASIRHEEPGGE